MQRGTDPRTKKVFETICYWSLSPRAFGTLKVNASGTCSSIQEAFSPSNANHQITYFFIPNSQTVTDVKANLEYKQIPPDNSSEGKIYRLFALNEDASRDQCPVHIHVSTPYSGTTQSEHFHRLLRCNRTYNQNSLFFYQPFNYILVNNTVTRKIKLVHRKNVLRIVIFYA